MARYRVVRPTKRVIVQDIELPSRTVNANSYHDVDVAYTPIGLIEFIGGWVINGAPSICVIYVGFVARGTIRVRLRNVGNSAETFPSGRVQLVSVI